MTDLKWGLTERCFVDDTWCARDDEPDGGYVNAVQGIIRCLTVNGVPLRDVLIDAAEQCSGGFPVERGAVLRALAEMGENDGR